MYFQLYAITDGPEKWFVWRLCGSDGRVIAEAEHMFASRSDCLDQIKLIQAGSRDAPIHELEGLPPEPVD